MTHCENSISGPVCLYLICGEGRSSEPLRPIKIGIASNPEKRIASIQTGSPRRLKILTYFDTPNRDIAKKFETAFHNHYQAKRLAGEWFDVDPIEALQLACNSFRNYLERMAPSLDVPLEDHLRHCGVLYGEREVKRFKAWRQYYAENSNVQAMA
jgi:hypothetical protein